MLLIIFPLFIIVVFCFHFALLIADFLEGFVIVMPP